MSKSFQNMLATSVFLVVEKGTLVSGTKQM